MKKTLVIIALAVVALLPAGRLWAPATVLCVDDASDGPASPADCALTCDGTNDCSLRDAITAANASVSIGNTIIFDIPGTGVHEIHPTSALPAIADRLNINGDTQPGYAGTPLIVLDGSLAGAGVDGLHLAVDTNLVKALVICGFSGYGLRIESGSNSVRANYIGTDPTGTVGVPNGAGGILFNTIAAQNNNIGFTAAADANIIAFNGGPGVAMAADTDTNNQVTGNSIFANTGLGIDLGNDGITPNDTDDADSGPDFLQNFPVLSSATSSGGTTTIQGSLNSDSSQPYQVEFFSNDACDPSGQGEGQTFLGSTAVTLTGTNATFTAALSADVASGKPITATAIDFKGNTSEFSPCVTVTGPGDLAFSAAAYSANENAGTAQVTVTRTNGAIGAVSVDVASSDGTASAGSDYTAVTETVHFADGDATPKTVDIPVTDDSSVEGNETVNFTLSNPQGSAVLGSQTTAVLTIVDNDSSGATTGSSSSSGGCSLAK